MPLASTRPRTQSESIHSSPTHRPTTRPDSRRCSENIPSTTNSKPGARLLVQFSPQVCPISAAQKPSHTRSGFQRVSVSAQPTQATGPGPHFHDRQSFEPFSADLRPPCCPQGSGSSAENGPPAGNSHPPDVPSLAGAMLLSALAPLVHFSPAATQVWRAPHAVPFFPF